MKKVLAYLMIPIIILFISQLANFTIDQSTSSAIFTSIVAGAIMFWRFRLAFALSGVSILFALGLLDLQHFIEYANLDVVVFLICMMVVIGFLEERRFFENLVDKIMQYSKNNPYRIVLFLMILSAVFAAMVDEVTSILFMMAITVNIASRFSISIIPLMLMVVFATNIGSSATVIGNPVGVMIAFASGYGFLDFLRWSTPIAVVALIITAGLMRIYFKKYLKEFEEKIEMQTMAKVSTEVSDSDLEKRLDPIATALFVGVIGGLVFHTQLELLLNLPKNTMLLGVPMIGAAAAIFIENVKARELVERRVDWWTILFFLLFFTSVGTLKMTGVTATIAKDIAILASMDMASFIFLAGYIVGLMSAFMDNILAVAFWIAVMQDLSSLGIHVAPLWWATLFGSTYIGNLTIIGSTANIVAVGMVERQRLAHVTLKEWVKAGILASFPPLTLALLLLVIQLPLMT